MSLNTLVGPHSERGLMESLLAGDDGLDSEESGIMGSLVLRSEV